MIRQIDSKIITQTVARLCTQANKQLPEDVYSSIKMAVNSETNDLAKVVLNDLIENVRVAKSLDIPICQDTGMAVVFVEVGQDVHILGNLLEDAINEGVKQGYEQGLLRKSIVKDPLNRVNTNTNTPAIIHTSIIKGDKINITVAPKGFGSENMSGVRMLNPSATKETVINSVLEIVKNAGSNPCPPMVVGVGIGGDFEYSAVLAKMALCRALDSKNSNQYYADLEDELLQKINELNIGPQGFKGNTTALKVNVEYFPTHIAGLPLAVNIGCHVNRHKTHII